MCKQTSSDTKTIKIQKLIEQYREHDNTSFDNIISESKTASQLGEVLEKQKSSIYHQEVVVSEFKLPTFDNQNIEGDRFIPVRRSDVECESILETKIEIDHCPPYNWNQDVTVSENSQQSNQNNN